MAGWRGRTVLVVSPTPTAPVDFGNRRYILNSFRHLQAQGARIVFVYYPAEHDWRRAVPVAQLQAMQAQWDEFYLAPVTRPLHADPVGSHHEVDEWWDEGLGGLLRWIFATHRIDVCIVNYTWLSRALTLCPQGVLKVLDTHDRFTGRKEMLEYHGIRPEFFYLTADSERTALMRADIVWAIKEEEARHFAATVERKVLVFPHFERAELAYRCRVPRPAMLRFGFFAAKNQINHVNYRRFFEMLQLLVRHWLLPARFILAGSLCDMFGTDAFPFIERLGRVETIEDFYSAVDVVVVPMAFSTGLKIKIGEAMGYGKALIAHAHAFDGYLACHRFHALDSYEAMGRAIIAVVDAPELIDEMEPASVRAARDAERRADHCAAATILGADQRRRFVLQVPADLLALPQVADHVSETCHYIGYVAQPAIYVTGDARSVPDRAWQQIAPHARLTAEPFGDMAAQDAMADCDVTFLDAESFRSDGCTILYSLRCDAAFAAWRGHAEETLLRLEHWGASDRMFEHDATSLAALLQEDPDSVVLIGTEGAEASLRRRGIVCRLVRMPLLHDGTHSRLLRALRDRPRGGLCLLAADSDEALLRRVVANPAFRARWSGRPRRLVAPDSLTARLRDDPFFAGFVFLPPPALPAHLLQLQTVPDLFVQLDSEAGTHAWLREICARVVLPFLSLAELPLADGAASQIGTSAAPSGQVRRARQVLNVLSALLSPDFVAVEKTALERSWPFARDSGWAWLWRLVSLRIDPG